MEYQIKRGIIPQILLSSLVLERFIPAPISENGNLLMILNPGVVERTTKLWLELSGGNFKSITIFNFQKLTNKNLRLLPFL